MINEAFLDDLRDRIHRGLSGQALRGHWCGGRPYGYKLRQIVDSSRRDAYGQPRQIGIQLDIDEQQAKVVREIFERYIAGQSHRSIAADLNQREVPSAGATWARNKHRTIGWMGSAIRVILMNRLYTGELCWNKTKFVRNPETERIVRRARPMSEWIISRDESRRIISDGTFAKAQARSELRSNADGRLKRGGKLRYLEEAFRTLKSDLAIRPIFHQSEPRIEAHVFIAFLAFCLYVTLGRQLKALAPGLTARSALEKFAAVQMVDVNVPTTDGRELLLTRYTQPEPELALLIEQLRLTVPAQPPPKITVAQTATAHVL